MIMLAPLSAFFYGLLLEVIQIWVPGRIFSFKDILANLIGSALGGLFLWIIKALKGRGSL